jgi:hypothetical protein
MQRVLRSSVAAVGKGVVSFLAAVAICSSPTSLKAQEATTQVMIRATSHDAKIIGTGVGGARISVYNALTGSLLARGMQEGGTGSTPNIMVEPRVRGQSVYDTEGAAGFLAELELAQPTQVRIEAEGPLGTPHATQRVTRTMLLVPGQHVLGDGVILELHGFTVELLEPSSDLTNAAGTDLSVRARVTMLCGCPTAPGGLWDSNHYSIEARIVQDGTVLETADLVFSGETSIYEGTIHAPTEDGLALQVLAMDPVKGNFGMAERSFDEEFRGQSSD